MTVYHTLVGKQASSLRRVLLAAVTGIATGVVLGVLGTWQIAIVGAWDATALVFLVTIWPIILVSNAQETREHAVREDPTRGIAALLLIAASIGSLMAVAATLPSAASQKGIRQGLLVGLAILTILLSWTVVNTVFLLRYAHLQYVPKDDGIDFGGSRLAPTYIDFAYVALTIGMTYQVSDTNIRDPRTRRTIIVHGLLSYLFGVVIVAGAINVIAGLVR